MYTFVPGGFDFLPFHYDNKPQIPNVPLRGFASEKHQVGFSEPLVIPPGSTGIVVTDNGNTYEPTSISWDVFLSLIRKGLVSVPFRDFEYNRLVFHELDPNLVWVISSDMYEWYIYIYIYIHTHINRYVCVYIYTANARLSPCPTKTVAAASKKSSSSHWILFPSEDRSRRWALREKNDQSCAADFYFFKIF